MAAKVCFWVTRVPAFSLEELHSETLSLVVPGWNNSEQGQAVLAYMSASTINIPSTGTARNRFDGSIESNAEMLGPDGQYIFPEYFISYITEYSVKPWDDAFIYNAVDWYNAQ